MDSTPICPQKPQKSTKGKEKLEKVGSSKSVGELVSPWESVMKGPSESSESIGVSASESASDESSGSGSGKKLPICSNLESLSIPCRTKHNPNPNANSTPNAPLPESHIMVVSAYDSSSGEMQWYSFEIIDHDFSKSKHILDCHPYCDQGSLLPIVRVPQRRACGNGWALLYEGQLLYRFGYSLIDAGVYPDIMNGDVIALDLSDKYPHWFARSSMSFERFDPHVWVIGGKVYVFGGEDDSDAWCESYAPWCDEWTTLPNPVDDGRRRFGFQDMFTAASTIGTEKVIFIGFALLGELYLLRVPSEKWKCLGNDHRFPSCTGVEIAAVGYHLFWFSQNHILYAYHVTHKKLWTTAAFQTLLAPPYVTHRASVFAPQLVHLGGNRFCLLYISRQLNVSETGVKSPLISPKGPDSQNRLHCFKFRATLAMTSLKISVESCQSYLVDAELYTQASLVNPELVWRDTGFPECLYEFDEDHSDEEEKAQFDLMRKEIAETKKVC